MGARTGESPRLDHLLNLTDDCGVIQHATYDVPHLETGYCVDDVARAFIVGVRLGVAKIAVRSLSFLQHAQLGDGRFHNFMAYDRRWLDEVGSEDAFGRAVWALGWGRAAAPEPGWRSLSGTLFERALPNVESLMHLRAKAYAGLGLAKALSAEPGDGHARRALAAVVGSLVEARKRAGDDEWRWFEPMMTYANARLPEALLRGGAALGDQAAVAVGRETLAFLEEVTIREGMFVPIGNRGWYRRGGERALYAQQPIEAAAMVEAELAAYELTKDERHLRAAGIAFDWFFGHNAHGAVMVRGGGCRDGLEPECVSANMGAESTLEYLMAATSMSVDVPRTERGVRR
ncbi:MAG TPA: hypothetical protein VNJ51_04775 [Candidatus Dormibacteraeota bacterium]|nr:hypothetical protein [Candidatus Dormibacteraeota bacterium]